MTAHDDDEHCRRGDTTVSTVAARPQPRHSADLRFGDGGDGRIAADRSTSTPTRPVLRGHLTALNDLGRTDTGTPASPRLTQSRPPGLYRGTEAELMSWINHLLGLAVRGVLAVRGDFPASESSRSPGISHSDALVGLLCGIETGNVACLTAERLSIGAAAYPTLLPTCLTWPPIRPHCPSTSPLGCHSTRRSSSSSKP